MIKPAFPTLKFCFSAGFIVLFYNALQLKSSSMSGSNFQTSLLTWKSLTTDKYELQGSAPNHELKSSFLQLQPILLPHANDSTALPNADFLLPFLLFHILVPSASNSTGLKSACHLSLVLVLEYLDLCNKKTIRIQENDEVRPSSVMHQN